MIDLPSFVVVVNNVYPPDLMVDISKYYFNHKMMEFIMHKILDEFLFNFFIKGRSYQKSIQVQFSLTIIGLIYSYLIIRPTYTPIKVFN